MDTDTRPVQEEIQYGRREQLFVYSIVCVFPMEFIILFSRRGYTFLKTLLGFKLFLEEAIGVAGSEAPVEKRRRKPPRGRRKVRSWNSHKS